MNGAISTAIDPENIDDLPDEMQDEDSESAELMLPPPRKDVQTPQLLPLSRKRTRDDVYSNSSDPPIFSSDDLPPGLENYSTHRTKRQHHGPWWTTPLGGDDGPGNGIPRQKREFTRNVDSGVWMNSDDTEPDGGSDFGEEWSTKAVANGSHDEDRMNHGTKEQMTNDGVKSHADDTPHPELTLLNLIQRLAMLDVLREVEEGNEVINLSGRALVELSGSTIQPLRYLTKQQPHGLPPSQEAYHPLTPSIRLYLANNLLTSLPGEIYKIENLVELSIRQNSIKTIPPSISNLLNLETINLSGNSLHYLPWELLDLVRSGKLKNLYLHPNPFFAPVVDSAERATLPEMPPAASCDGFILYAITPIAFLDITGRACANSPPAPSTTEYHRPWTDNRLAAHTHEWTTNSSQAPSLFELALRACANSSSSAQLPELLPDDPPPSVPKWLKEASLVKGAGGTLCSVCKRRYVVPRAEWIEWWQGVYSITAALPLLRRACSWGCASKVKFEINEKWRRCGWKEDEERMQDWWFPKTSCNTGS
ncbi:hypothetical protein MMC30_005907 [Trapelia coarctata]|nr:hypothetical protein [Trapelia coarctata]